MIKAVFFDLDETVLDASQCHIIAGKNVLEKHGINFDEALKRIEKYDFMGKRISEIIELMRNEMGFSEKEIPLKSLLLEREKIFLQLVPDKAYLLPGAKKAIKQSKNANKIVAIVSSGTRNYINLVLDEFGLKPFIDFIVTGEDIKKGKPFPDCYKKAYKMLPMKNIKKKECLAVEDAPNGVKAAKAAGLKVCFVPFVEPKVNILSLIDFKLKSLEEFNIEKFN